MSDQRGDEGPDYSADLSGTPEDTPDSPAPTRPVPDVDETRPAGTDPVAGPDPVDTVDAADPDAGAAGAAGAAGGATEVPAAAGPEVRRVRADDLRDGPSRSGPGATGTPARRRGSLLVGAGLLGIAALVGAFALGRATADDGPERFDPDDIGAPGAPFDDDDGDGWDHGDRDGRWDRDRRGPGDWGPGDRGPGDRHRRLPGPGRWDELPELPRFPGCDDRDGDDRDDRDDRGDERDPSDSSSDDAGDTEASGTGT